MDFFDKQTPPQRNHFWREALLFVFSVVVAYLLVSDLAYPKRHGKYSARAVETYLASERAKEAGRDIISDGSVNMQKLEDFANRNRPERLARLERAKAIAAYRVWDGKRFLWTFLVVSAIWVVLLYKKNKQNKRARQDELISRSRSRSMRNVDPPFPEPAAPDEKSPGSGKSSNAVDSDLAAAGFHNKWRERRERIERLNDFGNHTRGDAS
jgi:hypothetical protein